tara:strand:- start:1277 stop:2620 length:1344 start_codon:yes stop_codon:yes gene_type:complete
MNYSREEFYKKNISHDVAFASINILELLKLINKRTEVYEAVQRAIPELQDASIQEISEYLNSITSPEKMQYILNNVKGVLGEFKAGDYFESEGYEVMYPESLFNPGFDIALYDNGRLKDVVQIKTTSSTSIVSEHLEKYPDIPVYVTEDVYGEMDYHPNIHELNFSSTEVGNQIDDAFSQIDNIDSPVMDTFLGGGVYAIAFSTLINGFVLSKKGFNSDKFGDLTKHAAQRAVAKSFGASIGSVLGPVGMIGMGYIFGKIYDSYTFDQQNLSLPQNAYSIDLDKLKSRLSGDRQIGLLANEAKSMVEDSIRIGEYEASGMYNLLHQFNFMPEMIQPGVEMMYGPTNINLPPIPHFFSELRKKAIQVPQIMEVINKFVMIDEKSIINQLPKLIFLHTLFTNAYMDAATFGNNNKTILELTDAILIANNYSLDNINNYLSTLPLKNNYI